MWQEINMQYFISFLEGIITFISPCILPMIPIYITYFANGKEDKKNTLKNALGFVLGFSIVFISLGAFAGLLGGFLQKYQTGVNIVTGLIVIVFGLNFMGVIKIGLLNGTKKASIDVKTTGFFSSILFGIVFSIGWTPCVGAFLGSALMLASQQGTMTQGLVMLVLYSVGLGIPFVVSAILIDKLKSVFDVIKRNYKLINMISGGLLVVVGILMMTGMLNVLLRMFN